MRRINPSEPIGAATEKVVTYYRTPAHKKGREWLEKELGQMRLFEYNPAHLSVEKIGNGYSVLLNSQILKRGLTKAAATAIKKQLTERARKLRRNPDGAEAATAAREVIEAFDVNDDNDVDFDDVEVFSHFDESNLIIDEENQITGEIITETPDGDLVVLWADGKKTLEHNDDLLKENGFKSWRLRRKAARQYKKGLRHEELARAARGKQSEFESDLRQNPFGIAEAANLLVGAHSAVAIHDRFAGKKPRKNPATITQRVAAAKKAGQTKIQFAQKYLPNVQAFVEKHGGSVRRSQGKSYLHFAKENPAAKAKTNGKTNNRTNAKTAKTTSKAKRNPDAFQEFQGRPSTKVMQLLKPRTAPTNLYVLGLLIYIKIKGQAEPLDFTKDAIGKNFYLCADERNRQMWICGGRIADKDKSLADGLCDEIGEIADIVYMTKKTHLGDVDETNYIHALGEEGGERPILAVDNEGYPLIQGGDYEITPLGIRD